jgi:oxygen-independent coproporphyrinogen III oxidase
MKNLSLYIHIPFCFGHKCNYCSFVSFCNKQNDMETYVKAVCEEIKLRSKQLAGEYALDTIYFGGGTPSCIETGLITRIMLAIKENFKINKSAEISIECNPESLTREKLEEYKLDGINRLSIGVQSFSNGVLDFIGRSHTAKMAKDAIILAQKMGFDNISIDMMLGLPAQNEYDVEQMAKWLVKHNIKHISAYSLILENGTPLKTLVDEGKLTVPSDDETVDMYNSVYSVLKKYGYIRYEVSNFAQPYYECRHNLVYWTGKEYLGIGLASHSYIGGKRFCNTEDFDKYISNLTDKKLAVESVEMLTPIQRREEEIMLALRTNLGLDTYRLDRLYGGNFLKDKAKEIEFLSKNGFIRLENGKIFVCDNAYYVLSSIISKLV